MCIVDMHTAMSGTQRNGTAFCIWVRLRGLAKPSSGPSANVKSGCKNLAPATSYTQVFTALNCLLRPANSPPRPYPILCITDVCYGGHILVPVPSELTPTAQPSLAVPVSVSTLSLFLYYPSWISRPKCWTSI